MANYLSFPRQSPDQPPTVGGGVLLAGLDLDRLAVVSGGRLVHQADQLLHELVHDLLLVIRQLHAVVEEDVCLPVVVVGVHHLEVVPGHFPAVVVSVNPEPDM